MNQQTVDHSQAHNKQRQDTKFTVIFVIKNMDHGLYLLNVKIYSHIRNPNNY